MRRWTGGRVRLASESLREAVRGKRIGLMVNGSAIHNDGRLLMDVIIEEKWAAEVVYFLGVEHGVRNELDGGRQELGAVDPKTGVPIINLYNFKGFRPPVEELARVDAIVYCMQDAGVRHWTFTPWMQFLLGEAAKAGCEVIIVDRPNPLRGDIVEGAPAEPKYEGTSITGYGYPLRHGMTVGELALFYNADRNVGAKVTVLKMEGWERDMWYSDTGLMWLPPSPNIATSERLLSYLTLGLFQGSNLSMGHATAIPYEFLGHPAFSSEALANELNSRDLPHVFFAPRTFLSGECNVRDNLVPCHGVVLLIEDRNKYRAIPTMLHMMDAVLKMYPDLIDLEAQGKYARIRVGTDALFDLAAEGKSVLSLLDVWEASAREFEKKRAPFLLY